jgi:probable phosphoglycerate mutase
MKTELILVRHGETETNVKGHLHSDKDSQTLNKVGKEQVEKTAERLLDFEPSVLYSSKEDRAIESAKIIGKICDLEVRRLDGMQERNWGDYSGKPFSEVAKVLGKLSLEERYTYIPSNGESWKESYERMNEALNGVLEENKGGTIIIVTHGGTIRILMPYLLNRSKEETFKHDPRNSSITVFEYLDGEFKEVVSDDISHLSS